MSLNPIFPLPSYPYVSPNITLISIMLFFAIIFVICQLTGRN